MKYTYLTSVLLTVSTLLTVACGSDGEEQAQQRPPVPVEVEPAREERVVYYDDFPATVRALNEVEVRPQVAGYITDIHFEEGATVREGQRLYTIDTRQYRAAVSSSQADVAAAEADLALAQKDVERYRRLAAAEAVAQQTLDQAEATLEARRQAVERARAGVAQAQTQLDYATVRAPLSGTTGLAPAKVGTQVVPGSPLLTTISQQAPVGVDLPVPQRMVPRITAAKNDPEAQPDSLLRLRLADGSLYDEYGSVFAVDRAIDPATGTLLARIAFDNPDDMLRPGMNVTLEVLNEQSGTHVTVPATALAEQLGERYVYIAADTLALRRKVSTGARYRDRAIVTDGLEAGEQVVVKGLVKLRDSTRIAVRANENSSAMNDRAKEPGE